MARKANSRNDSEPANRQAGMQATWSGESDSASGSFGKSAVAVAEPAAGATLSPEPTMDQIRARAYEIYLARGGRPGDSREDWLQAERELRRAGNRMQRGSQRRV